jgi:hypothetical protein
MVTKSAEMSCNDVVTFFVNLLLGAVAQDLRLISVKVELCANVIPELASYYVL